MAEVVKKIHLALPLVFAILAACESSSSTFAPRLLSSPTLPGGGPNQGAAPAPVPTGESAEGTLTPQAEDPAIMLGKLRALDRVLSVTEDFDAPDAGRKTIPAGYRRFAIAFRQPISHAHPELGSFEERVSLLHRDVSRPMVLSTSGYMLSRGRSELTYAFATNQLQLEYRFFDSSTPRDEKGAPRYAYATTGEAAEDFHDVVTSFKKLYAQPWVSTGASKGGEAVVYARHNHPEDMAGTLAYVAPFLNGVEDPRPLQWAHAVGGGKYAACNQRLADFQRAVLARREELKPLIKGTYDQLGGFDVAIEHGIEEFLFFFFQYGDPDDADYGCDAIPAPDAPIDAIYKFFDEDMGAMYRNIDDDAHTAFMTYYVQCANEGGFYRMETEPFGTFMHHQTQLGIKPYLPPGLDVPYDASVTPATVKWLANSGDNVVLIYGEDDPWSGGMVSGGKAITYVAPHANHSANIGQLTDADRDAVVAKAQAWLGVPPVVSMKASRPGARVHLVDELVRRRSRARD